MERQYGAVCHADIAMGDSRKYDRASGSAEPIDHHRLTRSAQSVVPVHISPDLSASIICYTNYGVTIVDCGKRK
jgi:hypothetical protein